MRLQNSEAVAGIQRCQEVLARLNPSQQRVQYEKYESRELLVVNE